MKTAIHEFRKTYHFLLRQWDRNISDAMLTILLEKVKPAKGKRLLVVSRRLLRKLFKIKCCELFIKVDGNSLITCFFFDFQDYLNARKRENYFLMQ